jgi:hypothetical protein
MPNKQTQNGIGVHRWAVEGGVQQHVEGGVLWVVGAQRCDACVHQGVTTEGQCVKPKVSARACVCVCGGGGGGVKTQLLKSTPPGRAPAPPPPPPPPQRQPICSTLTSQSYLHVAMLTHMQPQPGIEPGTPHSFRSPSPSSHSAPCVLHPLPPPANADISPEH